MVEKILRVQPDVGQLYLVIQPQKGLSADDRLKKNVRSLYVIHIPLKNHSGLEGLLPSTLILRHLHICSAISVHNIMGCPVK